VSTAGIFDLYAEKYDRWYEDHRLLYLSELEVVRYLGCRDGLEIGVGSGRFASEIGLRAGIDPSYKMLRYVKGDIDLVLGVGEALPFRSRSYPCSLIVVTLCFAENPLELLREAARVSSRVVVCIVPKNSPWGKTYIELGRRGHIFYSHARFYTVKEVVEMIEAVGLKLTNIVATLSRGPDKDESFEKPIKIDDVQDAENYGFVCLEAMHL